MWVIPDFQELSLLMGLGNFMNLKLSFSNIIFVDKKISKKCKKPTSSIKGD
jgi:hypothetical protein